MGRLPAGQRSPSVYCNRGVTACCYLCSLALVRTDHRACRAQGEEGVIGVILESPLHDDGKEAQLSETEVMVTLEVASFRVLVTFCFSFCVLIAQVWSVCTGSSTYNS